jgi:hypothetical protein
MRAVIVALSPRLQGGEPPDDADAELAAQRVMGTRCRRRLSTRYAALDWNGETPFRTAGNDEQASSVARAG